EEAIVLRSGSNIIIRLYGVTFPVGRSTIEPQYFELLSRVMRAFDEFPDAQIIIEGHTDSRGSDELNLKLSQDRSQAVAQYFTAIDAGLIGKIQSEGYGESRPIASNDTVEGRTRNRRIDIVINPR
ncbi:MAG: OmpA family protein, partial [Planctomycetota bacterium]